MPKIVFAGVTKTFGGGVRALDGLDLEIRDGERLAIIGPVGCGKTTLLRLIAGLDRPTRGSIRFDGRDVTDVPPWRRGTAMVFQTSALYPHLTVRQNLLAGRSETPALSMLDELIVRLKLETLLNRRPDTLSGGQQRRVAIGRALLRQSPIVLLDEPLAHLDPIERLDIRQLLIDWHAHPRYTIAFVSHEPADAPACYERLAVLNCGKLEQLGMSGDVLENPHTLFVASFVSHPPLNVLHGRFESSVTSEALPENRVFCSGNWRMPVDTQGVQRVQRHIRPSLILGLRPDAVRFTAAEGGAPETGLGDLSFSGRVIALEHRGPQVYAFAEAITAGSEPATGDRLCGLIDGRKPMVGDRVVVRPHWNRAFWFDAADGRRIDR